MNPSPKSLHLLLVLIQLHHQFPDLGSVLVVYQWDLLREQLVCILLRFAMPPLGFQQ